MIDLLEARYEKDPSIVYREIAGEAVLVPIRRNVADMAKIYSLDPVAADIWKLIDGQRTLGDIRDALLAEYDVASEVLDADLDEFVAKLLSIGALKAC
ncbi:MAG: PqqD family protein [Anaerolineae bacterium]